MWLATTRALFFRFLKVDVAVFIFFALTRDEQRVATCGEGVEFDFPSNLVAKNFADFEIQIDFGGQNFVDFFFLSQVDDVHSHLLVRYKFGGVKINHKSKTTVDLLARGVHFNEATPANGDHSLLQEIDHHLNEQILIYLHQFRRGVMDGN